nr:hypothetical protein CFP56_09504 [Quercus suber]
MVGRETIYAPTPRYAVYETTSSAATAPATISAMLGRKVVACEGLEEWLLASKSSALHFNRCTFEAGSDKGGAQQQIDRLAKQEISSNVIRVSLTFDIQGYAVRRETMSSVLDT